jgi:hypothetical protein
MGLGKRRENRQQELWIAADQLARTPRHVFYEQLNRVLAKARFDAWVEERCRPYYAEEGRRSIPPGVYFRMLLVGYFEGIDSQRGIAWPTLTGARPTVAHSQPSWAMNRRRSTRRSPRFASGCRGSSTPRCSSSS